jgi:hypothetical protein
MSDQVIVLEESKVIYSPYQMSDSNFYCEMPLYIRGMHEPFLTNLHEDYLLSLYTVRCHFGNGDD